MILQSFCSVLVFSLLLSSKFSSFYSKTFNIGIFLNEHDQNEEEIFKEAHDTAMTYLKSNLSEIDIEMHFVKMKLNDSFIALKEACRLIKQKNIIALFGPFNVVVANQIEALSLNYKIPHFQFHWGFDHGNHPMAINMFPHYSTFNKAINSMVKMSEWKQIVLIYYYDLDLFKYDKFLDNSKQQVVIKKWIEGQEHSLIKHLKILNIFRFIVDIPYWRINRFLNLTEQNNMTTQYYNFLFTNWDTHMAEFNFVKDINPAANFTLLSVMNSRHRQSDSLSLQKLTVRSMAIIDSLQLLARGLNNLTRHMNLYPPSGMVCMKSNEWETGTLLTDSIIKASYSFVNTSTELIRFDRQHHRTEFSISVLKIEKNRYKEIGVWNAKQGYKAIVKSAQTKQQVKEELRKQTLRVVTIDDPPFVISLKKDKFGKPRKEPKYWTGFCIDLLKAIARNLNFTYQIEIVEDNKYGSEELMPDGKMKWNGMIGALYEKKADLAVASLTITYEREKAIDFTTPFMTLGLSIIFKKPEIKDPSLTAFLEPLSPPVWGYVLTAYCMTSIFLFFIARFTPYEWYNPYPCLPDSKMVENQFNVFNSFWFSIGSLMQQGSDLTPRATSTRIAAVFWWFFTLIIISSYTANLAAFLTVRRMKSPIENAEDLSKQVTIAYGTLKGGSSENFFRLSQIPTYKKMWNFMKNSKENVFMNDTPSAIARVKRGGYAFLLESTWNEYYTERNCDLMKVGGLLDSKNYGIGLPAHSKYRNDISEEILKLSKDQKIEKMRQKWWREYKIDEPCSSNSKIDPNKQDNSLGPENFYGAFIMLAIGLLVSITISFVEFCFKTKMIAIKRQKRFNLVALEIMAKNCFTCHIKNNMSRRVDESLKNHVKIPINTMMWKDENCNQANHSPIIHFYSATRNDTQPENSQHSQSVYRIKKIAC